MWKYNWNVDYNKYYNKNVIICISYNDSINKEIVKSYRYGKFIDITKPKKQTDYESTVMFISDNNVKNSITTNIIKFIKIDRTEITKKNYRLLQNYIVKNTNNDIYNDIYEYLTQDYIDI